jgi:uncharacterized protein YxjI
MASPLPNPSPLQVVASDRFKHPTYQIRKKIFSLLGHSFHIFDPNGQVVLYSKMKAFKLKEDIRVYTSEDMQQEVLIIKARNILDFSATYDVFDAQTQQKIGALKRKGLKSMLKDEWLFLDSQDQEMGKIEEDNFLLALLRRFASNLIPQHFHGSINNQPVCAFRQNFNPFVLKVNLDFTPDQSNLLDRRLGLAAAILLCAIEGRQE